MFEVSRKFQEYVKDVLRVFTESFKGVPGSLKGISRKFQEFSKEVLGKVQGSFMKVPRVFKYE